MSSKKTNFPGDGLTKTKRARMNIKNPVAFSC